MSDLQPVLSLEEWSYGLWHSLSISKLCRAVSGTFFVPLPTSGQNQQIASCSKIATSCSKKAKIEKIASSVTMLLVLTVTAQTD
ncbi:hypothetical protein J1N35_027195 [Gossypium stocksii]|uniref:Uncharacterized protein n=1 Tax=Gossypium stocksii TaxID=47602 RepID=A0A9D3ZYW4_9ROSI|nr:hypothetical protein J1N35_027195 [Gossypium stocksii]